MTCWGNVTVCWLLLRDESEMRYVTSNCSSSWLVVVAGIMDCKAERQPSVIDNTGMQLAQNNNAEISKKRRVRNE